MREKQTHLIEQRATKNTIANMVLGSWGQEYVTLFSMKIH